MPCYIVTKSLGGIGEKFDAELREMDGHGQINVPVRVELVSERWLYVDGEPRQIFASSGCNGVATICVAAGRRIRLAKASAFVAAAASKPQTAYRRKRRARVRNRGFGNVV